MFSKLLKITHNPLKLKEYFLVERTFAQQLKMLNKKSKNVFFIDIGANNGKDFNPLYKYIKKYGWSGILVEPQTREFKYLQKLFANNKNIYVENSAISEKSGPIKFFKHILSYKSTLRKPEWFSGRHKGLNFISMRAFKFPPKEITVQSLTYEELLKKYKVQKVDVLVIDTEGYDYEILKLINFRNKPPYVLYMEILHLDKKEILEVYKLLSAVGYTVVDDGWDLLAYQ